MLVIDPDGCIDCGLCVPECPVEAILTAEEVPEAQREFIALNAELSLRWPVLADSKPPLPDAEHWAEMSGKRAELRS